MSFKRLTVLFSFLTFLMYVGLIASLFYFFSGKLFIETFFDERTLFSIRLSFITATVASVFAVAIAVPSAYALSRYEFYGKKIVDTFLELPMIVSPAALGAMILIFFNNPLGMFIQENATRFVFTFYGIILAQFVTVAGIATRLIKAAMDEIPQRYEDVALTLGASHLKAFSTTTLPMAKKGIAAAAILTWAKAMGEFGATITVAGSMAMRTETLPIAIYMRLSAAEIEQTVVLILILIMIGMGILYGVRLMTTREENA